MKIASFRSLAHPLSQLEAAEQIFAGALAFVTDEWADLYKDRPPHEEEVHEWLSPFESLGVIQGIPLRFEYAGSSDEDAYEDLWVRRWDGASSNTLFHYWRQQFADSLDLDSRVIHHAFALTDLVLIPDPERIASAAYELEVLSMRHHSEVGARVKREESAHLRKFRKEVELLPSLRRKGAGPRQTLPAMVDKVALVLRDAKAPMTAGAIASKLRLPNVASVNATLHQCCEGRPKRIAGWVQRAGDGEFVWVP